MAVTVKEFFFRAPTTKAIEQAKLEGLPTPIKRAPLKLAVDVLDYNGIIDVIAAATDDNATPAGRLGGELLLNAVAEVFWNAARALMDDAPNHRNLTVDDVDLTKLTWEAIAATEPSGRSSSMPTDEEWNIFLEAYLSTMPQILPEKSPAAIANAASILKTEFKALRGNTRPVIEATVKQLLIYVDAFVNAYDAEGQAAFANVVQRVRRCGQRMLDAKPAKAVTLEI